MTYTLTLQNSGAGNALQVVLTDTLPAEVSFLDFKSASGPSQAGGVVTWNGTLNAGGTVTVVFTIIAGYLPELYRRTVTNSPVSTALNAPGSTSSAAFTFTTQRRFFLPVIQKP